MKNILCTTGAKIFFLLVFVCCSLLQNFAQADEYIEIDDRYEQVFSDVPYFSMHYHAIHQLRRDGIIDGYDNGEFGPLVAVNRAEFVKIVLEAKNISVQGGACFPDVQNQWFASYVCTAKSLGIIDGYDDGMFHPDQSISFVEAAKIFVETFELELNEGQLLAQINYEIKHKEGINYEDITDAQVSQYRNSLPWYTKYVFALNIDKWDEYVRTEILKGDIYLLSEDATAIPSNVTSLDQTLVRAQVAEMVWRILYNIDWLGGQEYSNLSNNSKTIRLYRSTVIPQSISNVGICINWGTRREHDEYALFVESFSNEFKWPCGNLYLNDGKLYKMGQGYREGPVEVLDVDASTFNYDKRTGLYYDNDHTYYYIHGELVQTSVDRDTLVVLHPMTEVEMYGIKNTGEKYHLQLEIPTFIFMKHRKIHEYEEPISGYPGLVYYKDKNHVYTYNYDTYQLEIVKDIEPGSFDMFYELNLSDVPGVHIDHKVRLYKDRNDIYYLYHYELRPLEVEHPNEVHTVNYTYENITDPGYDYTFSLEDSEYTYTLHKGSSSKRRK